MNHFRTIALAALTLPLLASTAPSALYAQVIDGPAAHVSLLPGWRLASGAHMAALRIKLEPGWHTYWRAPGSSGIPARFGWSGSSALDNVDFHWPVPTVYEQNGIRFIGYEDELVLPIEIIPSKDGDITISGQIEMGVCKDVCLPFEALFEGTLLENITEPDASIQASLRSRPKQLHGARCSAEPIADGMKIQTTLKLPSLGDMEMAVLEHPNHVVWISDAEVTRVGRSLTMISEVVPPNAAPFFVDRSELTFTVIGNGTAYEAKGCTGG
jgi:DsbC/DsbD-like thiol-disulfide interchange protein